MKKNNRISDKESKELSRRNFIGKVGAATAGFMIVPRNVLGGKGYKAPSDMINVAGIGIGARGAQDIQGIADPDVAIERPQRSSTGQPYTPEQLAAQAARAAQRPGGGPGGQQRPPQAAREPRKLANIYALCDVDTAFAAHVFKGYPKAKVYTDWREMLEKEKSIDAVVIGTPDHNHAPIAAAFMRQKKHVYVEKPLCKTITECRKLAELAKQYDVVTQMGNQGHATEGTRQTVEWVQSGLIGFVREVHLSTNRPSWPQGNIPRPSAVPVPKTLNYDIWLGPAPNKPYNPELLHFNWRGLWDYGTGAMGDMGAHIFDAPIWALNLGMPTRIQATSSPYSTDYLPQAEWVTYEFPSRGYLPPVKVTWCDGGLRPPRPAELEPGRAVRDATYYGDKGIMMHASHGAVPELVPADKDFKGVDPWLPRTGDIYEDWIGAILAGKKSCNDFSISTKVTEIMLLTNIALLTKGSNVTLEYDAANMKITNLPEANQYFHYEYRKGWTL
ncbi:MAG: Gfo/Idh/MocA family oxidoreductase [Bacteroidales bacterium]|nr:Gfo/Idh/MocA family oxidoreductase [Bacteroidales bacterium]